VPNSFELELRAGEFAQTLRVALKPITLVLPTVENHPTVTVRHSVLDVASVHVFLHFFGKLFFVFLGGGRNFFLLLRTEFFSTKDPPKSKV
jgi:hypothetical protein